MNVMFIAVAKDEMVGQVDPVNRQVQILSQTQVKNAQTQRIPLARPVGLDDPAAAPLLASDPNPKASRAAPAIAPAQVWT